MVPPGFFLMVCCKTVFRAELFDASVSVKRSLGYEKVLPFQTKKGYFVFSTKEDRKTAQGI
jgi:hypothetical protein